MEPAARTRPPFIGALEGLRGLAAALVVVYHSWLLTGYAPLDGGPVRAVLSVGFVGVNFFFVLSGFVLFLPTCVNAGSFGGVRSYAARRAARIVPAYWVALLAALLLLPLLTQADAHVRASVTPGSVLAHVFFLSTEARLVPGYQGALGFFVNAPLWTLSVEAAFYVVLPLVAARYWRHPLAWAVAALALAAGLRGWIVSADAISQQTAGRLLSLIPLYFADFAVGMTAAWAYVRLSRPGAARLPGWAWPAVSLGGLAALTATMVAAGGPDGGAVREGALRSIPFMAAVPLSFGALALGASLSPARAQWPAANPFSRWLGKVSYSMYLYHFMVIGFCLATLHLARDGSNRAFLVTAAIALLASMALGWLSYVLVERPARRLARRLKPAPAWRSTAPASPGRPRPARDP